MKKIIRLTESDLIRLVKRVINEQPTPSTGIGKSVANDLVKALSPMSHGKFIDDDAAALKAIKLLKNKADYDEMENELNNTHKKYFCNYLESEMSDLQIEPKEYMMIMNHVKSIGGADCVKSIESKRAMGFLGRLKKDLGFNSDNDHKSGGYETK